MRYLIAALAVIAVAFIITNRSKIWMQIRGSSSQTPPQVSGTGVSNSGPVYMDTLSGPASYFKTGDMPYSGTKYYLESFPRTDNEDVLPIIIRVVYPQGCEDHQYVWLFQAVRKDMESEPCMSGIQFECVVDQTEPYPKIFKIKVGYEVTEYKGEPDYGALRDWILDDRY
jgi:hypothetical protein